MKLIDIKNLKKTELNAITEVLQGLVEECFEVDLEGEDLQSVYNIEITEEMMEKISEMLIKRKDEWTYTDVMRIIGC
jgi:regulator of replication initiation timing